MQNTAKRPQILAEHRETTPNARRGGRGRPRRAEGPGTALCAEDEGGILAPRHWRRQNPKTDVLEF